MAQRPSSAHRRQASGYGPIFCELLARIGRINPAIADSSPPSHHRPPTASKAIAPQIAAQSPNDSSNTRISASPLLSERVALASDRESGDRSTPTLQKSAGRTRSAGAIFLSIPSSPTGGKKPSSTVITSGGVTASLPRSPNPIPARRSCAGRGAALAAPQTRTIRQNRLLRLKVRRGAGTRHRYWIALIKHR